MMLYRQWFIVAGTTLLFVGQTCSSFFKSTDYLALYEFYNATQGNSWTWDTPYSLYGIPWDFNLNLTESNPCAANWQGLNCSGSCVNSPCSIVQISLSYHNLQGRLPNSLSVLSDLQAIVLNNNVLTGSIPTTFEDLRNLSYLNLANNQLNGSLPANLGSHNLSQLDLSSNKLSGELPYSIGNWMNLEQISVSNNLKLNGHLPTSLGNLIKMKSFSAATCSIDGKLPTSLGNWTQIQIFNIGFNSLSGSIPYSFSAWSMIETFDVRTNALTGSFPSYITQFSRLVSFYASNNQLEGTLPQNNFQNLGILQEFLVFNNKLFGPIPYQLFNDIPTLIDLSLYGNLFSQTLPSVGFQNYSLLMSLSLDTNHLSGTLPAWLFSVPSLSYITIFDNEFRGSIPNVFSNSSQLYSIIGDNNQLTGTIPSSFNDIATLAQVSFVNNRLYGTVSPQFVRNTQLFELSLGLNSLSGSIPNNFGKWSLISHLDLHDNHLNGTIPATFFDGGKLQEIYLQNNHLEGKIVHLNFSNLPRTYYLALYANLLTGSIPDSVANAVSLSTLLLFDNLLTGTLPKSLATMPSLAMFGVSKNLLHGDISHFLLNSLAAEMIDLSHNSFSGTFEVKAMNEALNTLYVLDLCSNSLTGTMPINITTYEKMHLLFVNDNQMYGVLPEEMTQMTSLQYLNVSSNFFEGTPENFIPPTGALGFINLAENFFTGSINKAFNQLRHLFMLILFSNFFTGPIDTIFDPQQQQLVMKVDVSSNYLTGTIPGCLFSMPLLQSVVAATNCITGSIPPEACSAQNLSSLVLDGMHASLSCNRKLFSWQNNNIYYLAPGTNLPSVPDCLFILPQIRLLHISGNGIRGKLDPNLRISPTLMDLDLSQNSLSGPIPPAFYNHYFETLDLSFNQFNGTIPSSIVITSTQNTSGINAVSYSSLKLQVNRLSGSIPASLRHLPDISILEGNMFACDGNEKVLPQHDPKHASYDCGSDSTNAVLIAWISTVLGTLLLATAYFRFAYHSSLRAFITHIRATIAFSAAPVVNECIVNEVMSSIPRSASLVVIDQNSRDSKSRISHCDLEKNVAASTPSVADVVRNPLAKDNGNNLRDTYSESITKASSQQLKAFSFLIITSLPKFSRDISKSVIYTNHLHIFYLENQFLCKFLVMVCLYVFVVMMTIYASLKDSYGTYTIQYIWDLSFAYLKGISPSVAVMVPLFILVMVMHTVVNMHLYLKHSTRAAVKLMGNSAIASTSSTPAITADSPTAYMSNDWKYRFFILTLIFLLNSIVVLVVNGAYVVAVSLNYSRVTLQFISFLISVFKLTWSHVIVLGLIENLTVNLLSPTRQSLFLVVLSIFNNIVAPYAAEAFVSADCFEYALIAAPTDTSTIVSEACFLYSTTFTAQNASMVCNQNIDHLTLFVSALSNSATTVSFNPPFSYSYQCSSTLVSVFSNVFVVRYLLSGVVQPILVLLAKQLQLYCLHRYGIGSSWFRKVSGMVPILIRPITPSEISEEASHTAQPSSQVMDMFCLTNDAVFHNLSKRFTLRKAFTVRMISDLAVLLTFGLFFPPLAVVVTCSMLVEITMVEYGMGHIARLATLDPRPQSQLRNFLFYLNDTFDGFGNGIWMFFPYLTAFCAIFWSFSFFDTLGDDVNALSVAWVFPFVISFPIIVELLVNLTLKLYRKISYLPSNSNRSDVHNVGQSTSATSDSEMEMSTFSKK